MLELGKHSDWNFTLTLNCTNCIYKDRERNIDVSIITLTCMSVYIGPWLDSFIYVADINFMPNIDTGERYKTVKF